MVHEGLAADNLFQLNVLIWGLLPLPPGAPVAPVLSNLGYRLRYVEFPLNAGVGELGDLQAASPRIGPNPVADLVLERNTDDRYVLVECKASSYGAESSTADQGRGLLVAGARVRARLGVATGTAEACFVVPASQASEMDASSSVMQRQVRDASQPACNAGSVNIEVRADGVYVGREQEPTSDARLPLELRPMAKVLTTSPGQDPRPLYVVPWIPDASASADLFAFREKVRAELLARLGKSSPPVDLTVGFDDVLDAVSHGIYRHWRDKNSLHSRVFQVLGSWIRALTAAGDAAFVRGDRLEVRLESSEQRDLIMETVRTAALPERTPAGFQPTMFDEDTGE